MISRGTPRVPGRTQDRSRVLLGPVPVDDRAALRQVMGATRTKTRTETDEEPTPPESAKVVEWTYRASTFGETDEVTKSPAMVVEGDGWLRNVSAVAGSGSTTVEVYANGSLVASCPTGSQVSRVDKFLFAGTQLQVRATTPDAANLTVEIFVEGT